jgi:hypothetical protein
MSLAIFFHFIILNTADTRVKCKIELKNGKAQEIYCPVNAKTIEHKNA